MRTARHMCTLRRRMRKEYGLDHSQSLAKPRLGKTPVAKMKRFTDLW